MEQHFGSHPFIGRFGIERVSAGQVEYPDLQRIGETASAGFFIDGNARKIADFLAQSGQGIEQRTLPRIRIADKCYLGRTGQDATKTGKVTGRLPRAGF